jgi:hypothetical protein
MPQTTMHDYFKNDMASTSPRACTSGALTTDSQDVTILSREEWWACAREREVKDYHRRMTKRGILSPLPYSLNWSQNYEYELGVPQYRWDTGETIGRYYPGIVHIALAQRLCQPRLDQVRPLLVVAEQHLRNERQEVYIRTSQLIVLSGERKREAVDSFIGWRITRTEQRSPSAKPFSSTSADSGQWPAKNPSPFECFPCVRPDPVLVTG